MFDDTVDTPRIQEFLERMSPKPEITRVLELASGGDAHAVQELLPLVYDHLRILAAQRLARESPGNTLQPTALVHEAFMKIAGSRDATWTGRKHFFNAAALAMRRILVDRARARKGPRRGGDRDRVSLEIAESQSPVPMDVDNVDWIVLEEALQSLQAHDLDLAHIVNLRYFAGLSIDEVSRLLETSPSSIDRDWKIARAWLLREMNRGIES